MTNRIPKVSKKYLLLIAGIVWLIAGVNITRLGTPITITDWQRPLVAILTTFVTFSLFFRFVFFRMVQKHTLRILTYEEEKIIVTRFFDRKGYIIMFCMISFGILLRSSHLLLPICLSTFYTGLGISLIAAGIYFFHKYVHVNRMFQAQTE